MDEKLEAVLNDVNKKNKTLWLIVFSGIIILILISIMLNYLQAINAMPIIDPVDADKIALLIILSLAIVIFFIKRSFLIPSKIIELSRKSNSKGHTAVFNVLKDNAAKQVIMARSVEKANRFLFIVWFLADLIIVIAFVNYILAPVLQTFLVYSVVGLYSLFINFPSKKLLWKIYDYT